MGENHFNKSVMLPSKYYLYKNVQYPISNDECSIETHLKIGY
jgi:hypothetical protein